MSNNRITILDSFRCLAILFVILMHLGSSYSEYYPYGSQLKSVIFINNGYLGVHLFFMISGFVIFMSLERCKGFAEFIVKRITRLLPTLLFCCLLTFCVFKIFDSDNHFYRFHNTATDFFPSLTFTDLWIWNRVFHKQVEYIDGVYWTLSYEMKFYILSAAIYYMSKANFYRNWLIFAAFVITSYLVTLYLIPTSENVQKIIKICLFPDYIVLFTLGMYFYLCHSGRQIKFIYTIALVILTLVELLIIGNWIATAYILIFILLFVIFVYKIEWLSLLSNRFIVGIGVMSYPLYLIHSHIGVLLVSKLSTLIHTSNPSILISLASVILLAVAYLIHCYIEMPTNSFLRKYFFNKVT
jgi:peptidoglycan/LPS O-acetylase OafA/YrhL